MIQPRDLPILRDELLAHLQSPKTRDEYRYIGRRVGWAGQQFPDPDVVSDSVLRHEQGICRVGELFYVNDQMTDVAQAAGKSLPSFRLDLADLPATHGLLVYSRPIGTWTDPEGRELSVIACSWAPAEPGVVLVNFYTWREANLASAFATLSASDLMTLRQVMPQLIHDTETFFRTGMEHEFPEDSVLNTWGRTLIASWLLMQQPGVSARQPHEYSKLDKAWLKRRRFAPGAVTVVRLRYMPSGNATGEQGGREYHHQWMVRGHWRKQWYPSRESHVPIWISPYIKGPEGAPIKSGERVHAWVR